MACGTELLARPAQCKPSTIGIEIVNPGHEWGYRAFLKRSMKAVSNCRKLSHGIDCPARRGCPLRYSAATKKNPVNFFNWQWLATQGVGLWPGKRGREQKRANT